MKTRRNRLLPLFFFVMLNVPMIAEEWDCYPLEPVFYETHQFYLCLVGPCLPTCSDTLVGEQVYCGEDLISGWGWAVGTECVEYGQQCDCQ